MEQQPLTPQPKHKNAVPLIVGLLIIILILAGILLWCWFYKDPSSEGSSSSSPPASTTSTSSGPCDGEANTVPAGFTFYENASFGFKFAYPSSWGTVSTATTPMGGTAGHYLVGSFSANENVSFGGNATDYTVSAREGIPTDNPGYLQAGGKFYTVQLWKLSDGATSEPKYDLYPIEGTPQLKEGCNADALVSQYPASEILGQPPYDVARFNLKPTNLYYGVNFVLRNPTDASRAELDKLITTFQLIP